MNKIFSVVLLMIIVSCSQKKNGPFVVSGHIANAGEEKIYLEQLPYDGTAPVITDSATLKKNGLFELRALGKEEQLYRIVLEDGTGIYFVNDNNHLKVRMNKSDFRHPVFENSNGSSALYTFINHFITKDSLLRSLYMQADSLHQNDPADSMLAVLTERGKSEMQSLNQYVQNFVNEQKNPAVAYFGIAKGMEILSPDEARVLVVKTAERFPSHAGLTALKTKISVNPQENEDAGSYALLNKQAPDLSMEDINGKTIKISDFKGKYVLVDFWASWCKPCRMENPNVVKAFQKYKDRNFTVLGVSLDKDKDAWVEAIKNDELTWPHMSDLKFWESAAVPAYQFDGIPFNVLLDPTGKIIAYGLRGDDLQQKLDQLLK